MSQLQLLENKKGVVKMKNITIIFLTMLFFIVIVDRMFACSCPYPHPPLEALAECDAVFKGTVIEINNDTLIVFGDRYYLTYRVKFSVTSYWKGITTDIVDVYTAIHGISCGFLLKH